jgi:hemerythrin superfamily protein
MRIDLYGTIHKAQRFHLLRLCAKMGRTDFADAAAAERICGELKGFIAHLRDHARNEETYIHPLYRTMGRPAEEIEDDHKDLEKQLRELETFADEKRWAELYSTYARFLGVYLLHLDEEEKSQAEVLWPPIQIRTF